MKHRFLSLLATGVGILTLCACTKNESSSPIPKDGKYEEFEFKGQGYLDKDYFALKKLMYNLTVGESAQIEIDTLPSHHAADSYEYVSKNSAIVSVDANGILTANSNGIADVEVNSKDGKESSVVRVVVSAASTEDGCKTVLDNIDAIYSAEDYQPAKRVIRYQYSTEMYYCEGEYDHGMEDYEVMAYDSEAGYFYIEGPTLYYKTPGGTPELAEGKWIMYPINYGVMTRLIHVTPRSKNYFDINTAAYKGDYDAIIRDIINFFFVDGEKILNNLIDTYDGKEDFYDFPKYSGTTYRSVDDESFMYCYHQEGDDTVSASDEINYYDIPADTPIYDSMDLELLNSNARCIGYNIASHISYELGGKDWRRDFIKSQLFGDDFEVVKIQNPKDNGYNYVDSLYDL